MTLSARGSLKWCFCPSDCHHSTGQSGGTAFLLIAETVRSGNVDFGIGSLSLSDNDQNADQDIHGQRPDKKP